MYVCMHVFLHDLFASYGRYVCMICMIYMRDQYICMYDVYICICSYCVLCLCMSLNMHADVSEFASLLDSVLFKG